MLSQTSNRVQAIKSKFESLTTETESLITRKKHTKVGHSQLGKQSDGATADNHDSSTGTSCVNKENTTHNSNVPQDRACTDSDSSNDWSPQPNSSFLHKSDVKRSISDPKKSLSRQFSDPGKKLHRSHAFRCDKSQKILSPSPKRHGSCYGRPETSDHTLKTGEKKLSKERLNKLGVLLEDQMRKENFVAANKMESEIPDVVPYNSIPDEDVPQYILEQYAKVLKPRKNSPTDNKHDLMTDSGVSSETENLDDDRSRLQRLKAKFETEEDVKSEFIPVNSNLDIMKDELCASSETIRLEKKNPHLKLTPTLKKALKQPLPPGPPPKKPPRTFASPESSKKDTKQMLHKLEQVLQKREEQNRVKNIYDIAETNHSLRSNSNPKEIHYLCTEILDITQRTLLPNEINTTDVLKNCLNSLNCAIVTNRSMTSLPYCRLSDGSNCSSLNCCSSTHSLQDTKQGLSTFFKNSGDFQCHLKKKTKKEMEHIYDVPFCGTSDKDFSDDGADKVKRDRESGYGVVNSGLLKRMLSRSMEDLRVNQSYEDPKIYEIPCDESRPATPEPIPVTVTEIPKSDFEKLRSNFENGSRKGSGTKVNIGNSSSVKRGLDTGIKTVTTEPIKDNEKPLPKPKPVFKTPPSDYKIKSAKSTENLSDEFRSKLKMEKRFATESKRYRKFERNAACLQSGLSGMGLCIAKKERKDQLDVDKENLNRLMNEIYDTVTAACRMDEQRPTKFPTESDSTSEDSVKLTRSLTEKRKNYVRRVSSRAAYIDPKSTRFRHQTSICSYNSEIIPNYSTFRTWKSFRNSQNNINKMAESKMAESKMASDFTDSKFNLTDSSGNLLSMKDDLDLSLDNISLDDKAGCCDLDLPFEKRAKGLFDICLLVGLNYMTGEAYVKSVFPTQVKVPPHIENLIFPETISRSDDSRAEYEQGASRTQTYSLVLTDEKGERNYGYCRRVLPEGATVCLPLCYCMIGRYRAPGFYYKILKEIESHHGSSDVELNTILQQLYEADFPNNSEDVLLNYNVVKSEFRYTVNLGDSQIDFAKCKTLPGTRRLGQNSTRFDEFSTKDAEFGRASEVHDAENNNVMLYRSDKVIKRPLEPRVDEDCMSVLLDTLGAGLLIKVFGSLLLERKVVLISDNLSQLSSCMEALQLVLYPFVWQHPLISTIPAELTRDMLEAPLPMLAGSLATGVAVHGGFEEAMLINISDGAAKVLFYVGDESTILPTSSYKTLKTTLQMETSRKQETQEQKTRNVMISEAFLRFFVDILQGFWRYFSIGQLTESALGKGDVVFDKESFVKSASSKQSALFLEWFTETSMFNHFAQNMAALYTHRTHSQPPEPLDYSSIEGIVDAPLPNFYVLFGERVMSRNSSNSTKQLDHSTKTNYKSAVNKKVKILKSKLRDLVT